MPSDTLNITIRIADCAPLGLTIKREDEPEIRQAEYDVNRVYKAWCKRYTSRSPHEVLAMVAFQFAKNFNAANLEAEACREVVAEAEAELDKILLEI